MAGSSHVLIVDDSELQRKLLCSIVEGLGHRTSTAENGLMVLSLAHKTPPDIILLDLMMPEMDGFEALRHLKADPNLKHIPVIVISSQADDSDIVQCLDAGADDHISKPVNPVILTARLESSIQRKRWIDQTNAYRKLIESYNLRLEDRVKGQVREITQGHLGLIIALSQLAESRDAETGAHLDRMREYCRILAQQMRIMPPFAAVVDEDFIENIYTCAPLHDIGKVSVPDRILQKPGKLSDPEFEVMKLHTVTGAATLQRVQEQHRGNAFIEMGLQVAASHHERWDGKGYPNGLSGEAIPLPARILALADVYDALTSERCYREAFSHERSKEIILRERGRQFDPNIVDAFASVCEEFPQIRAHATP